MLASYVEWQLYWAGCDRSSGALVTRRKAPSPSEYRSRRAPEIDRRQLALDIADALRPQEPLPCIDLRSYSVRWLEERKRRVITWANDEAVLRLHVLPLLGSLPLDQIRPRHLVELFEQLREKAVARKYADGTAHKLSARSLYNVYGTVQSLFRDARIEDLLLDSPCILTKYQLGEKVDANPEWRASAIYTRAELLLLLTDARVPEDRRVLYGLEGVGGLRHGEAAGLRFRHLLPGEPLGMLVVARSYDRSQTKTATTRYMPIHGSLARLLDPWKAEGWERMMGRAPTGDDLVVPLEPTSRRGAVMRKKENSWRRIKNDLAALGLRHRRGHDLRRTMISLSRSDGADRDILRRCTHKPPREVLEGYTTYEWDVLCREVSKLQINLEVSDAKPECP